MKRLLALAIVGMFALAGAPAFAADPPAPAATPAAPNAQQQVMKTCNTKATGMKGDERKTFMSACLSGKDAPPAKMTQQEKMKVCNTKAEGKKGDDRKAFMSDCLKAAPPA
jgi:hypothetical protein